MDNGFATELARLGPDSSYAPYTFGRARAYCRRLTNTHYENFSVASLLLPRRLLPHFHAVYAYCRWADDLGDETGGGTRALSLLAWWRAELLRCYDGQPRHPVMIALAPTIQRFHIPPEPFLDLLTAFEQDQRVKRYDTYEQLLGYCRNSANPVGRLVLYLCECFDERKAALSDSVCTGLQLANFWQDAGRDLDIGRVYLPAEDRRRFGYGDADLEARRFTPAFRELMHFEVERARALLLQGLPLVPLVPADVQADIELFIRGGLGILDKIAALDYDVWRRRPVLAKWDKAALVGGVLWRRVRSLTIGAARNGRACGAVRAGKVWEGEAPAEPVPCNHSRSFAGTGSAGASPSQAAPSQAAPSRLAASYRYCENLTRREAGNFYPAFRVLPRPQRLSMCALYAFMRIADDLSDEPGPVAVKRQGLQHWRASFEHALNGTFSHPAHAALAHTMRKHAIPREYLDAVLDGVEMDLEPVAYRTFDDLRVYCYRVASAVGLACIHIWGFHGDKAKGFAEQAGMAFQLTNILRDLGEDAARGRVYLPQEDLSRFGYTASQLQRGERNESFQALMRFEIERARTLYASAWQLVPLLEPPGRAVFLAMANTYRGLLNVIEERDYDVFSARARVSRWRKLLFALRALPARWIGFGHGH